MGKHRCSDAGGRQQNGEPCGQVTKPGSLCRHHTEEASARLRELKKRYVEALRETGLHVEAGRETPCDPATAWHWRQSDATFAADVALAEADGLRNTLDKYEESIRDRVLTGKAAPVLEIWWVTNKADRLRKITNEPLRYKHVQKIEMGSDPDRPLRVEEAGRLRDELEELLVAIGARRDAVDG